LYKRELLLAQGIEKASSVLDVGCGDLEVVGALDLKSYVGLDSSLESLERATKRRPDWSFLEAPAPSVNPADFVLCFEVAIHQAERKDYDNLIGFLADKTARTLIISGYESETDAIASNHMVYFHEPLSVSLGRTGRFEAITKIGAHSDVTVFRCDVAGN
jgi:hypothetical protein